MARAALTFTAVLLVVLLAVPMLFAGGDPPPTCTTGDPASMTAILATIRELESGGNYQARASGSSASGAYQFLDSTWDGYGGYPAAWLAPPDVQDAKATASVTAILEAHDHDVSLVPVVWYLGHVPADGSTEWDTVPAPSAGNALTPREYQTRWMAVYEQQLAGPTSGTASGATPSSTSISQPPLPQPQPSVGVAACTGELLADGWALPGPRALLDAHPDVITAPHGGIAAWDWPIPEGTPVFAIRGGTVTSVDTFADNWWTHGCDTNRDGCDECGTGLTITDSQGVEWTYCHGSTLEVEVGAVVTAGTLILRSGNTGRSTGPHLHVQIRVGGTLRCPQPLVESLYTTGVGIDPAALPATGCIS
jgi:murein DD-endopeptidase MepM/ murein hydrolase activator NlpD